MMDNLFILKGIVAWSLAIFVKKFAKYSAFFSIAAG